MNSRHFSACRVSAEYLLQTIGQTCVEGNVEGLVAKEGHEVYLKNHWNIACWQCCGFWKVMTNMHQ